jgi:hypothetical protein
MPVGLCQLVGHDHLVARVDQPHEVVSGSASGAGPAAGEETIPIEPDIEGAGEREVVGQQALGGVAIAGGEGQVQLTRECAAISYCATSTDGAETPRSWSAV